MGSSAIVPIMSISNSYNAFCNMLAHTQNTFDGNQKSHDKEHRGCDKRCPDIGTDDSQKASKALKNDHHRARSE
jgi:hypothetical protein